MSHSAIEGITFRNFRPREVENLPMNGLEVQDEALDIAGLPHLQDTNPCKPLEDPADGRLLRRLRPRIGQDLPLTAAVHGIICSQEQAVFDPMLLVSRDILNHRYAWTVA